MQVCSRWAPAVAALGMVLAGCQADPTVAPPRPDPESGANAKDRVTIKVIGMT